MMKQTFLLSVFMFMAGATAMAQEALWGGARVQSPVINADGSVTFNVYAPKAVKVEVTGDFLPTQTVNTPTGKAEQPGVAQLEEAKGGVWSFKTAPLQPELYNYTLRIDGQSQLDPANVYVSRDVASLFNIFVISRAPGDRGDLYRVNEVPHGDVARVWYDSPTLGMKRRMTVYTPPAYDRGKNYPVLYLLHGAGGDEEAWTTLGRAAQILDNLIATGRCKPMLVVMPNGNCNTQAAPGEWSKGMYQPSFMASLTDNPASSMAESFPDIVKYVESHYRVAKNKRSRAVCGLSMGGGHSFQISKRWPDTFGYVGLFSAGLHIDGDSQNKTFYELLTADAKTQQQLARLFAAKPALYWIGIGKTDFLYQQNEGLRRFFDEKGYPYEYLETEGGHIWRNWRIYLTEFAQKIFK